MPTGIGDAVVPSAFKHSESTSEPIDTIDDSQRRPYPVILYGSCEGCGTMIIIGEGLERYQCPDCAGWEQYDHQELGGEG